MSLLIPDTGLLFWMTLSFVIVLLALAKFGFPIITGAIEKRRSYISSSLEAAKKAEEQLASLDKQAEAVLDKAYGERNKLLKEAQSIKSDILEQARKTAEEETRQRLARAAAEIEELKRKAMGEVMEQIAGISVKIAEKVVEENLSHNEQQRELIDRLLKEETCYKA